MSIDWSLVVAFGAPLIAVGLSFFLDYVRNPPSLVTVYLGHASGHLVNPVDGGEPYEVNTHSVVILNNGRRSASNVRLTHKILPDFRVFPDVEYQVLDLPGGGREILFPSLVRGQQITVSYLYFPPITWTDIQDSTRSDDGFAKVTRLVPKQQFPRWLKNLEVFFLCAGGVGLLYMLFDLLP